VCWVIVHYASGFGAVEARLFRYPAEGADGVAHRFLAWNTPIHFLHAGILVVALLALLWVPLRSLRRRPRGIAMLLALAALSDSTGRLEDSEEQLKVELVEVATIGDAGVTRCTL